MKPPRFISLFSGCGGFDQGFIEAGFKPRAAFDIWPLAVETYKANLGKEAHVWDLLAGRLPPGLSTECDVVIAGSPCQGFSTVGKRLVKDPRNLLYESAVEIAISLKPSVIVLENVPGILAGNHKKYFEKAVGLLKSRRYKAAAVVLDAQDCGVPQSRRRVIVIAWKTGACPTELSVQLADRCPSLAEVIEECEGLPNHHPVSLSRKSYKYLIARRIGQGQKLSNVRGGDSAVHTWEIPEVFGATSATERRLLELIMRMRRRDRIRSNGDADPVSVKSVSAEYGRSTKKIVDGLISKQYLRRVEGGVDLQHTFNGKFKRLEASGISYAVDTHFGDPRYFLHPNAHRGFSVRETARIQGFPDSFVFKGSRRDQYRLIGNAVPPPMGRTIATFIKSALLR